MRIGIIAEGPTDQIVIEALILAHFADADDEPLVRFVQPTRDESGRPDFGGWELVFESLRLGRYREALQTNDLVVIHVDTDVCDRRGFDVSRMQDGRTLAPRELVTAVIARLVTEIDPAIWREHADRLVFAIAVNEIECWLLPMVFEGTRAEKLLGCCDAVSHELRKQKRKGLAAGGVKFPDAYTELVRALRRRKDVDRARKRSVSLDTFVTDLDAKCQAFAAPGPPPSSDGASSSE